ncbi:glycosyltransferase family 4 protein [Candidatus Poribacteria bacterium]|nr:glycosyltransferase family 4 protein [Candidatus Poribacteria bacterium]
MRIGISALMGTMGGPRTYTIGLIKALAEIDNNNKYIVFTDKKDPFLKIENIELVNVNLPFTNALPYWDQIKLPLSINDKKIDIFHHTKNVMPEFIKCKSVVTIHDMAIFLFPKTFTFAPRTYYHYYIMRAIQKADLILTVSENSKKDIINLSKIKEDKVKVVPNGVSEIYKKIDDIEKLKKLRLALDLPEHMILYVGTIQPRKNVDILIRAFNNLKKSKKIPHKLVIVGRRGWMVNEIDSLIDELDLKSEIKFIRSIQETELPIYYNLAEIFAYPSSYEGFGLTPLEAMACGAPVITSNVSSLPEVTGDAAVLIEPRNIEALTDALNTLITDSKLREELSQKGLQRSKQFSWKSSAKLTLEIYKKL